MKVYGYVRDKDGNFDNRKEKVVEFSNLFNFDILNIICEKSDKEYENMNEIRSLLKNNSNFVLIVSDTSDLFEDDYSRAMFLVEMDNQNVFLIDANYPNFDYKKLLTDRYKVEPSDFLMNTTISILECYLRKRDVDDESGVFYSDMRQRLEEWKSALANSCDDL